MPQHNTSIKLAGDCNINELTTKTLNKWWNEVKSSGLTAPTYDETKIKNFGIMANGPTTGFACTYNKCSNKLLCLYDQKPTKGNVLYQAGSDCTKDDCKPGTSSCVKYLCRLPKYVPSEDALPKPMCGAGTTDGMTYEMQMTVQDMINYYRRLVGTGWAKAKNGYAPIAKLMPNLVYNCDVLGKLSKTITDKCEKPPYTAALGRTMSYHYVEKTGFNSKTFLQEAIKTWAEQSKQADIQTIGGAVFYQDDVQQKASDWANVTKSVASSS
ncbi:hypothetical protein ANCDUO_16451 [Ancylostoma duodenale]|uniref:SCP domain-containing protein n=1 Tax=Ancylostoma duodenale TaxID=51022 RepID=A0A0C2G3E2_9BILA|nr:hypothetical protein ANCDUO_16451 [Ancylostoma duodenale]